MDQESKIWSDIRDDGTNYGGGLIRNPLIKFTPENLTSDGYGVFIIRHNYNSGKIVKVTDNQFCNAGYVWKLVYQLGYAVKDIEGESVSVKFPKYGLCNALSDGWTKWIGSKEEVCKELNECKFSYKYRFLTLEELVYIITNRKNSEQLARNVKISD